jgi:hypothetical protein
LVSAGGALDERFEARVVASVLDVVHLEAELDLRSLQGSLQVQLDGERLEEATLSLSSALTAYGPSGSLAASTSYVFEDFAVAQRATLLQWPPPEDCQDVTSSRGSLGTFPVTEDDPTLDFAAEAPAHFSAQALPLVWSDGTTSELLLEVVASDEQCVSVNPADGSIALGYFATLQVETRDASWTGDFPVSVVAYASPAGELTMADVFGFLRVPVAEVDTLGMPALEVGDAVELELRINALWSSEANAISGYVSVAALGAEQCRPLEPSEADGGPSGPPEPDASESTVSPGCVPDYAPLAEATLGP